MIKVRRWLAPLVAAWLACAPLVAGAQASDVPRTETQDEAIARDALAYAGRYGVPADRALQELHAQIASVPVTDAIAREFAGRLVGMAIDRSAGFRIVVLLTGDEAVAPRSIVAGGIDVPILFRVGAAATQSEILTAITHYQAPIRASLERPPGMGLDSRTGELVVMVGNGDAARLGMDVLAQRFAAMTGVPVRVEPAGAAANMMVGGGSRVVGYVPADTRRFLCTTGFAVTDGLRTGVATAAHCPDELSYIGPDHVSVAMPFVAQAGWGYQDVQINASPTPLSPAFFADTDRTLVRPVESAQGRASTRAGDFVCHRGERTGYSCAEVLMTDFAPAGDLCGGACLPTWVAVEGPTCQGGDSGAPVFSGTAALGLVKGGTYRADGSCAMYYYMSVDYLPQGWSLLTAGSVLDPPAAVGPAGGQE